MRAIIPALFVLFSVSAAHADELDTYFLESAIRDQTIQANERHYQDVRDRQDQEFLKSLNEKSDRQRIEELEDEVRALRTELMNKQ